MPNPQQPYDVVVRRGHGSLPIGLKFLGLSRSQGIEAIRIRFSLDNNKILDMPLSAEALADLVQILQSFRGRTPAQIPEEIDHLNHLGLISGG